MGTTVRWTGKHAGNHARRRTRPKRTGGDTHAAKAPRHQDKPARDEVISSPLHQTAAEDIATRSRRHRLIKGLDGADAATASGIDHQ